MKMIKKTTFNILTFFIAFTSMQAYASKLHREQGQPILVPEYLDNLDCSGIFAPLDTAKKITRQFLCDKEINDSLRGFQKETPYTSWKIKTEESPNEKVWSVKARGQGFIPGAYCSAQLNELGEITHRDCQYNK